MAGDITTIARPYAEAVFERAAETGQVDRWSASLTMLAGMVSDPHLAIQIANPNCPRERIRDLILQISGDALPTELGNLVRLLSDNARLAMLPEIASLYEERRVGSQGVRQVLVRSAFPVDSAQEQTLAAALARRFGAQVDLTIEEDPDLIGGVEIRAGDLVIDDSVRGKLTQLSNALQF